MDEMNMNIDMSVTEDIAVTADLMQTAKRLAQAFADAEATAAELTELAQSAQPLTDTTPLPPITDKTTLGELLNMLNLTPGQKRNGKTPTRVALFAAGGLPIAEEGGSKVYRSGYVLYDNGIGRHTILWLPYCVSFTYHFNKLRDAEKEYLKENAELPDDFLLATAWPIVVALFGEERITQNMFHGFGNCDTEAVESEDDEQDNEVVDEDTDGENFSWDDETLGVDPLDAVIRRENRERMLAEMTEMQRKVFVLHYKHGWTQQRIAKHFHISQVGVKHHLDLAEKKARAFTKRNF
mgnify:CR=1 FL=1